MVECRQQGGRGDVPISSAVPNLYGRSDMDEPTSARFFAKVNKHGPVPAHRPDLGPCWVIDSKPSAPYGYFWFEKKNHLAHRFIYEQMVGPIPEGLTIDHLCRNTKCVNYEKHLEPVSAMINILRGEGEAARNIAKTRCVNDHEFSEENTYWYPDGRERGCKECRRAAWRRWRYGGVDTDSRHNGEKTRCVNDHVLDEANTYIAPKTGKRACKTCRREIDREIKRGQRDAARAAGMTVREYLAAKRTRES